MFSKVGHIFSENNKCVQSSAVNYSKKEPHWLTVCVTCPGVQAAYLVLTRHTIFSRIKICLFIHLQYPCLSFFSECLVERNTTFLFFFGVTDNRVILFVLSNAY